MSKILELAETAGFILTDDKTGVDWASNYDEALVKFALLAKASDKDYVLLCEQCAKDLGAIEKSSWQGLSDDEIARLVLINEVDESGDVGFARLIEQALKEKNAV